MNNRISKFILAFIILSQSSYVHSHQPYEATVTVSGVSASVRAPNLVDLSRELKSGGLEELVPIYTPTSATLINIDLRGIIALGSFAENSTDFVVQIPQAGTSQTFSGKTRDDSIALFKDSIKEAGTRHKLLKAYARYSPIDPIAGNPNSLMAQMAQADFLLGRLSPLSGCSSCWSSQPIIHQFQAGLNVERAFSRGFDTTTVTLPLRYSYSPTHTWAIILDAPFTYVRNGGASSLYSSLGSGFRLPLTHNWSITSVARLGFGGSMDLCTSGTFFSTGLMSTYDYKIWDYVLSMTNYAGYFTSTNLWLTGINFNYKLHSYIVKNGLSLTSCSGFTVLNRPVNISLSFTDSVFTRERLYIKHYDEVSVSLITNGLNPYLDYDCLTLGFAYQFGQKHFKGYSLNMAYQF